MPAICLRWPGRRHPPPAARRGRAVLNLSEGRVLGHCGSVTVRPEGGQAGEKIFLGGDLHPTQADVNLNSILTCSYETSDTALGSDGQGP